MTGRPLLGMAFGAGVIGLALISILARSETAPAGYWVLDYGLILVGLAAIIGSVIAHRRKN